MPVELSTTIREKSNPVDIVVDRNKTPSGSTLLLARTSDGQNLLVRLPGSLLNGRAMFTTSARAEDIALLAASMGLIIGPSDA
jgi:hypothetical protein